MVQSRSLIELIQLAKQRAPALLVSASGCGDALIPDPVGAVADFILFHLNRIPLDEIPAKICVANGASWGLMAREVNQYNPPFRFEGYRDDPLVYAKLKELTIV